MESYNLIYNFLNDGDVYTANDNDSSYEVIPGNLDTESKLVIVAGN